MNWWEPWPDLTRYSQEIGDIHIRWPLYRDKGDGDMPEYEEMKPTPIENEASREEARRRREAESPHRNPWEPLSDPGFQERYRSELRARDAARQMERDAFRYRVIRIAIRSAWVGAVLLAFGSLMIPSCLTSRHVLDDPDHYSARPID